MSNCVTKACFLQQDFEVLSYVANASFLTGIWLAAHACKSLLIFIDWEMEGQKNPFHYQVLKVGEFISHIRCNVPGFVAGTQECSGGSEALWKGTWCTTQ